MQGAVKGGRRQGRQRKRWEDNIREWTGLEFGRSKRASGEQGKMEKTGCKITCGAPTTLTVKGLMMMMMMMTLDGVVCSQILLTVTDASRILQELCIKSTSIFN